MPAGVRKAAGRDAKEKAAWAAPAAFSERIGWCANNHIAAHYA